MKKISLILTVLVFAMSTRGLAEGGASCPEGSVYVPHHVAYCDGYACHTVVEEGRCVPEEMAKTRAAKDFSCGSNICHDSVWGRQEVCCVTKLPNTFTKYSCRREALSCPGNQSTLQIRSSRNVTPSES